MINVTRKLDRNYENRILCIKDDEGKELMLVQPMSSQNPIRRYGQISKAFHKETQGLGPCILVFKRTDHQTNTYPSQSHSIYPQHQTPTRYFPLRNYNHRVSSWEKMTTVMLQLNSMEEVENYLELV